MRVDLLRRKRLAAFGAYHDWIEQFSALAMLMQERSPTFVDGMYVSPMDQSHDDRIEVQALLRENVLVPLGRFPIWNAAENAEPYELFQPLRKQMASYSENRLEPFKSTRAQEAFPKYQEAPSIANNSQSSSQ